ncbi:hypothetical protein D1007_23833 [Hordeum vulgare]|nr:hypothetical protein D1007_23833 [Hordeum vulgare]
MYLGCEAHFELWRKLFCVMPCSHAEKLYEVGAVEVCRIKGTGYPSVTPGEHPEVWSAEWFYIDDVTFLDPVRPELPPFCMEPSKRRYRWRSQGPTQEESAEVTTLATQIKQLTSTELTIIDVMAMVMKRRVQLLRQCSRLLCEFNGTDDASREIQDDLSDHAAFRSVLTVIYQGMAEDFGKRRFQDGLSNYNRVDIVKFSYFPRPSQVSDN